MNYTGVFFRWSAAGTVCRLCGRPLLLEDKGEHLEVHAVEPLPRRESRYVDEYLDATARPETRYTIGTFFAYRLRGKARQYSDRYARALEAALLRRVARGEVVPAQSVRGGRAFVRAEQ